MTYKPDEHDEWAHKKKAKKEAWKAKKKEKSSGDKPKLTLFESMKTCLMTNAGFNEAEADAFIKEAEKGSKK